MSDRTVATMTRRRALLRIAPELLAERLGLEPGVRVLAATSAPDVGTSGTIALVVEGGTLPERPRDQLHDVRLICAVDEREGRRHLYGAWSTAPDAKWPINISLNFGAAPPATP